MLKNKLKDFQKINPNLKDNLTNNIKYQYNKFILERYLNEYNFKHIKIIKNINKLKRDNYHIINNVLERDFLHNMFDTK